MRIKRRNSILLLITTLFSFVANGQYAPSSHEHSFKCGHQHPSNPYFNMLHYQAQRQKELDLIQNAQTYVNRSGDTTYVIPIVFHVIHEYGSENISDDQIKDAVRILNEDYAKLNADTAAVVSAFDTLIGDVNLEFRLANLDYDGNCTNGIERIYSLETRIGDDDSKMRLNFWPRDRYLNVWIVKSMDAGVAGYAYYPSATTGPGGNVIDGIIIRHNYIGSLGTSNPTNSRALTHEIGHFLGLSHTWGSDNQPGVSCGDDFISDTPVTKGWNYCNLSSNDECNPGIEENVENYMEYSYCSKMFTIGQAAAMRAVLNDATAFRNKLWLQNNLVQTGVDVTTPSPCAPISDFIPEKRYICTGETVQMLDHSHNGTVDTWNWIVNGATPATSSDQFPNFTFNSPGRFSVTLITSNANGSDTMTLENYIIVNPDAAQYSTHVEDFESFYQYDLDALYPALSVGLENTHTVNASVSGTAQNTAHWELATDAGSSGNKSIRLDAYLANEEMYDEFITPAYDLRYLISGDFTFTYTSASNTNIAQDRNSKLKIYSSTDCGKTWALRKQIVDQDLDNAGLCGIYYVPNSPALWEKVSIPISPSLKVDNVRFKFEYVSGDESNNIFIDDIGIEGLLSASTPQFEQSLEVYPNPANWDDVIISFTSNVDDDIIIQVYDVVGKELVSIHTNVYSGENLIRLSQLAGDLNSLSKGIVLLNIGSDKSGATYTKRLVID